MPMFFARHRTAVGAERLRQFEGVFRNFWGPTVIAGLWHLVCADMAFDSANLKIVQHFPETLALVIPALAIALALAGCAQTQHAADWLASHRAQKAAANLKAAAAALDCGLIAPGAALSREIAGLVKAGEATVDRAGKAHAVSAAICEALGGTSAAR